MTERYTPDVSIRGSSGPLPEGDHRQPTGGIRGERSIQLDNFLSHYISGPEGKAALLTQPSAAVPSDLTRDIRAGFEALSLTDRTTVITTLIQGQVTPGLLPISDVEGNRRAARALLAHLPLEDRSTRYDAAQAYSKTVKSLGDNPSLKALEALKKTARFLLTSFNRRAEVFPEEVTLNRAVWDVTQRVDQARSSVSPAEEVSDPVQKRREVVAELTALGFKDRFIGRVTGYSALDVNSDLSYLRKVASQPAAVISEITVDRPETGIRLPGEVSLSASMYDAVGNEEGLGEPTDLELESLDERYSGRRVPTSQEDRERRLDYILGMLAENQPVDDIARTLGVTKRILKKYLVYASIIAKRELKPSQGQEPIARQEDTPEISEHDDFQHAEDYFADVPVPTQPLNQEPQVQLIVDRDGTSADWEKSPEALAIVEAETVDTYIEDRTEATEASDRPTDQQILKKYHTRIAEIEAGYASGELVVGRRGGRPETLACVEAAVALRESPHNNYAMAQIAAMLGTNSNNLSVSLTRYGNAFRHKVQEKETPRAIPEGMPKSLINDPALIDGMQAFLDEGSMPSSQIAAELGITPSEVREIAQWITQQKEQSTQQEEQSRAEREGK